MLHYFLSPFRLFLCCGEASRIKSRANLFFSAQRVKDLERLQALGPLRYFNPLTLCVEKPLRFVTPFALLASRFASLATNHFPKPIADA
jgi:hypothetical protein